MLSRNNTSYPSKVYAKLTNLYNIYRNSNEEKGWTKALKYYQYLVKTIMSDPEYGLGEDGNARGLLIYHTMGMGKTRLGAAVAMSLWEKRQVIIMLPKSLQNNFKQTVYDVIDMIYPDEIEAGHQKTIADRKMTFVSMDAYNSSEQLAKSRNSNGIHSNDIHSSGIHSSGLDNKVLIVDEAHNFFRAIINSSDETSNARKMYDMIMAARNLRLLFLTGTPASKDPFELVPCFNMLAGMDILPVQYDVFYNLYIDRVENKLINGDKLSNRLMGLVSHVTPSLPSSKESFTPKVARDDGWFPEELPCIVERVEMGYDQYKLYLMAREKEEQSNAFSFGSTKTSALSLPGSEKKSSGSYFVHSRMLSIYTPESAPKLKLIAQRADASPGPVLVYSQFVELGLKKICGFLEELGFIAFSNSAVANKTYAIISGEISSLERINIVQKFNSQENAHGEIIKAILVSKTGAEGLDLKWLRETHQIEPYWDKARDHQVIARAVRLGSHDGLPRDERVVQSYLYISMPNKKIYDNMPPSEREEETIDELFYNRANKKYKLNSEFRKLLTTICFECALFEYGKCRICSPTNVPLYHENPELDARLPDPCEIVRETEVSVNKIQLHGKDYYYREDLTDPLGYKFYEYRDDLNSYSVIEQSHPIVTEILNQIV